MSDNVTLPGTAAVVATDDVGGAHIQRIKLVGGPDGTMGPEVLVTPDGELTTALKDLNLSLRLLFQQMARPISQDMNTGQQRARVTIDAAQTLATVTTVTTVTTVSTVTTVTTVTTVSTVTNLAQMGGYALKDTAMNTWERDSWANNVRRLITG